MEDIWNLVHDQTDHGIAIWECGEKTIQKFESKIKISSKDVGRLICKKINTVFLECLGLEIDSILNQSLKSSVPAILRDKDTVKTLIGSIKDTLQNKLKRVLITNASWSKDMRHMSLYTLPGNEIATCGFSVEFLMNQNRLLHEEAISAQAAAKAKDAFMASMSHEIRTPLNGIIGTLSILEKTELTSTQREYLNIMSQSSFSLMGIVNDILDMAKLENEQVSLHKAVMSIQECLESSYDILRSQSREKGLDFTFYIDDDVPEYVVQDFQRLKQILVNLLSNAVKFTEKGAVVTEVSLSKHHRGRFWIKFSIRDTGIGISKSDQKKLFQNFSKIENDEVIYPGTGLGLAISKGFVELMHGTISVESKIGKGSTFTFVIPVVKSDTPAIEEVDPGILSDKLVLVVDDNSANVIQVVNWLDDWGMEHRECNSARQAMLSYINNDKYRFDIGLLDICMPGTDGNRLAERIKRTRNGNFPLIALSSAGDKTTISSCFDYHLTKPYEPSELQSVMINLLNGTNPRGSTSKSTLSPPKTIGASTVKKLQLRKKRRAYSSFRSLKIIVAEDNINNQKVIKAMLEGIGYRDIEIIDNGKKLVDHIKAKKKEDFWYDLVLMDMKMPVMDGLTATKKLRKIIPADHMPWIVAITAAAMPSQIEVYMEEGKFDDYITKPITDSRIVADAIYKLRRR